MARLFICELLDLKIRLFYSSRMKKLTLLVLALSSSFVLTSCGGDKAEDTTSAVTYSQCLETEAAKLLDETGSNADYANEMAAKACEALK